MGHARARPDDLEELKQLLTDRVEELALQVLGKPDRVGSYDWRWGKKGGRSLIIRTYGGKRRGTYTSFNGGEKPGSPLDLIRIELGISIGEAIGRARDFLGLAQGISLPPMSAERRAKLAAEQVQRDAVGAEADKVAVDDARAIWAVTVPLQGTLGDRYLRDTRRIDADLPSAVVRWHPILRAVVLIATNDANELRAIQLIHVGPDGHKLPDAEARKLRSPETKTSPAKAKWTRGRLKGAAVRLPGAVGGPLAFGEGPETGLSAWAATRHETRICLGGVSGEDAPAGRIAVLLVDEDRTASSKVERILAKFHARGVEAVAAWPFGGTRTNGSDFNTLLQEQGEAAVRARIEAVLPLACERDAPTATLGEATAELRARRTSFFKRAIAANVAIDPAAEIRAAAKKQAKAIRATIKAGTATSEDDRALEEADAAAAAPLPLSPHVALDVQPSLGKTYEAVAGLAEVEGYVAAARAAGTSPKVHYAVPRLDLADQVATDIAGRHLSVGVLRGRDAPNPEAQVPPTNKQDDTGRMCLDLPAVRLAVEAGANVAEAVCGKEGGTACMHRSICPFYRNIKAIADRDVVVSAHWFLSHALPTEIAKGRNLTVIDEKFALDLAHTHELALDQIEADLDVAPVLNEDGPDWFTTERLQSTTRALVEAVRDHDDNGPISAERLQAFGLEETRLRAAAREQHRRWVAVEMYPGQPLAERRAAARAAGTNKRIRPTARLFLTAADVLAGKPDAAGRLQVFTAEIKGRPDRRVFVHVMRELRAGLLERPVLHLDGTMVPDIVRRALPRIEIGPRITAKAPHTRFFQVLSTDKGRGGFGKRSLIPKPIDPDTRETNGEANERRRQAGRLGELRDWFALLRLSLGPGLVVTYEDAKPFFTGLDGVAVEHFNAIAGLNAYANVAWVVVLGRPLPGKVEAAIAARQVFGQVVTPEDAEEVEAGVLMADGSRRTITTRRFPTPEIDAIRRAIADDQVVQAGERGRAVRRTAVNPLTVIFMTDVVVPYALDGLLAWPNVAPDRVERMAARGLVLQHEEDAAAFYPDLFKNKEAARDAMKPRALKSGGSPIVLDSMGDPPDFRAAPTVRFKPTASAGKKPRDRTAVVTDLARLPGIRAELEALAGPLARFEIIDASQAGVPAVVEQVIVAPAPVMASATVDEDEEGTIAARHLAADRRRQGVEPSYTPGVPVLEPLDDWIARVAWRPGPGYFAPLPGQTERQRAIVAVAGTIPWVVHLPPSTAGPDGWIRG